VLTEDLLVRNSLGEAYVFDFEILAVLLVYTTEAFVGLNGYFTSNGAIFRIWQHRLSTA
jgi:hypothetical protein